VPAASDANARAQREIRGETTFGLHRVVCRRAEMLQAGA
jgi:hypothetical protein